MVEFVRGPNTLEEKTSFENKSNADFVREQKMRMSDPQPSTSRSQKPRYVRPHQDRRTCFACGEVGHVSYKCPHSQRPRSPPETVVHRAPQASKTPRLKVDLGMASKGKSVEQKRDVFYICSGRGPSSSSALFDYREKLVKKHPELKNMTLEEVDRFVKQLTSQAYVKTKRDVRSKSPHKVYQPKAGPTSESVTPLIYQKKTLSKQQQWKPRRIAQFQVVDQPHQEKNG